MSTDNFGRNLLMLGLVTLAGCAGLVIGTTNEQTRWQNWALENDYAHFDRKTGQLILLDKEYWKNQPEFQGLENFLRDFDLKRPNLDDVT
jgi:hypothetical protein